MGKDGDDCLIIACLSAYHCSMTVEYSWLFNGTQFKQGRKSCIVYVTEPGVYQCSVKVNDNEETTHPICIITETNETEMQDNRAESLGKDLFGAPFTSLNMDKDDIIFTPFTRFSGRSKFSGHRRFDWKRAVLNCVQGRMERNASGC